MTTSNVEIADLERVLLDEVSTGLHEIAHENGEDLVGLDAVLDAYLEERASRRVHRRLPELLGVHLAEALVALDAETLATELFHLLGKLGRQPGLEPVVA